MSATLFKMAKKKKTTKKKPVKKRSSKKSGSPKKCVRCASNKSKDSKVRKLKAFAESRSVASKRKKKK